MLKKFILLSLVSTFFVFLSAEANWLSSAANALKSAGSSAVHAAEGVASGAANAVAGIASTAASVGLGAAAQLSYCRQIASVPGGTMSAEYQMQCGNMAFVCQQLRMTNPQVAVDPYCATVSGMGQMMGPWGGATSSFTPGYTSPATTPTNTDPTTVGWSVPAPPPYGFGMGTGAYGVSPLTASGLGSLLAGSVISKLFGGGGGFGGTTGGYPGGSFGGGGYPSGSLGGGSIGQDIASLEGDL